jgi:hypothetical protein
MNVQKIALLVLLAVWARPVYSGSAAAGGASSTSSSLPAANPARASGLPASATATNDPLAAGALPRVGRRSNSASAGAPVAPVLVIPAKEMDAATYGRIVEDLGVMSRIIEKSVRDLPDDAYGLRTTGNRIYVFLPSDNSGPSVLRSLSARPKALYIGGYGAVFSLHVDFPLVPPPAAPEPNKTAEKGDQVWAAAQRELANPAAGLPVPPGTPPGPPYRAEALENLRSALIAALQHASNVRDLEPESWLTILVQGTGTVQDQPDLLNNPPGNPMIGMRTVGTSLLTLRVKKSDIDQFAKGQLDQAQFQQRVQIAIR